MNVYLLIVMYHCPLLIAINLLVLAIVLFGEPNQWDSKLQLIVDILVSNGMPYHPPKELPSTHLPVLACNMDLFWMAEVPLPRYSYTNKQSNKTKQKYILCLTQTVPSSFTTSLI